jgi:hypothetical protein
MLSRAFDNESFSLQRHRKDDVLKRERAIKYVEQSKWALQSGSTEFGKSGSRRPTLDFRNLDVTEVSDKKTSSITLD